MRQTLFTLILVALSLGTFAQRSLQSVAWSLSTGTSSHIGDMASFDPNAMLQELRPSLQTSLSYFSGPRWGLGCEIGIGSIHADNANHGNNLFDGLSVDSRYLQTQMRLTYHLSRYGKYWRRNASTPYLFSDVGLLISSSTFVDDVPYPLGVVFHEGTNFSPLLGGGIGWKVRHGEHWSTFIEGGAWSVPGDRLEGFTWEGDADGLLGPSADAIVSLRVGLTYAFYTW